MEGESSSNVSLSKEDLVWRRRGLMPPIPGVSTIWMESELPIDPNFEIRLPGGLRFLFFSLGDDLFNSQCVVTQKLTDRAGSESQLQLKNIVLRYTNAKFQLRRFILFFSVFLLFWASNLHGIFAARCQRLKENKSLRIIKRKKR